MASMALVDLGALLSALRAERTKHERAIATHQEALATLDRDLAVLEQAAAIVARSQAATTGEAARPGSPIPRIPPGTPRLSPARITELATAVRAMSQREAVLFVGQQEGAIQAADAQQVLRAAGKGSPGSSDAQKVLTDSARFEKIGAGRFCRRNNAPVPAIPPHDAAQERSEGHLPATR